MATEYNITLDQGTDYRLLLTMTDAQDAPINLTGFTFRGFVKTGYAAKTASFQFNFEVLNQTNNPGKVYVVLPARTTSVINITSNTTYVYDVEMTTRVGETSRLFEGRITLRPEVSK